MFKKKCKCTSCLFKSRRINRCSLDKKCYLLCEMQQSEKTLNLRDLRIMISTQKLIEKLHRNDSSFKEVIK